MWRNMVEPGRPEMAMDVTQGMRKTLSECVILTDFPLQLCVFKPASLLRDTCIACLVLDPTANSKLVLNFFIVPYASLATG